MSSASRIPVVATLLAAFLASAACERAAPPSDSTAQPSSTRDTLSDSSSVTVQPGWPQESGPFLAIPDDSMASAMIITGTSDSAAADGPGIRDTLTIDLFTTAGKVGAATLIPSRPGQNVDQCQAWPSARVRRASASRRAVPWSVGFVAGRVLPLPMDSLAGLPKSDSSRMVAEIARLVSSAPNDTSPIFRGLPFRVETAYLVHVSDSETVLVSTVIRNINQEANARAEHLLLVASRSGADSKATYTLRYFERNSGLEETAETADVLGALLVGSERRPTIVLGRSDDSGMAFSLLQRNDNGSWTLQWSSAFSDC